MQIHAHDKGGERKLEGGRMDVRTYKRRSLETFNIEILLMQMDIEAWGGKGE